MTIDEITGEYMADRVAYVIAGLILLLILFMMILSSGCVTAAREIYADATATPVPTPTPTPIPTPTPTPIPTLNEYQLMVANGGYIIDSWHQWYREDVDGLHDMVVRARVYNIDTMPQFHWHDPSWGTRATRLERATPGYQFVFVFVQMQNLGTARTWGWDKTHFYIDWNGTIYHPIDDDFPLEKRIVELDNTYTRDHVENVGPYGYTRIQDLKTGVYTIEPIGYLKEGATWDGFIIFELPQEAQISQMKTWGVFDNVGGNVFWILL